MKSELSLKSNYHISKHRYYELKHFCMQYSDWENQLLELTYISNANAVVHTKGSNSARPVEAHIERIDILNTRIALIKRAAWLTDNNTADAIILAVKENLPYDVLLARGYICCSRIQWYALYRKFFAILDRIKGV